MTTTSFNVHDQVRLVAKPEIEGKIDQLYYVNNLAVACHIQGWGDRFFEEIALVTGESEETS